MTRSLILAPILAMPLALALVACGDDSVTPAADGDDRGARGEVLGGTISDDMIPLDQLQSRSPPLRGEDDASADENGPGTETTSDSDTSKQASESEETESEGSAGDQEGARE